jgi:hypothetical protein
MPHLDPPEDQAAAIIKVLGDAVHDDRYPSSQRVRTLTRSSPTLPRWRLDTAPKPQTSVLDWRERLVCSRCKSREVDMVVTGTAQG